MKKLQKLAKLMSDHTALVVIAFAVVTFIFPAWMSWVNHAWFTDFATNRFTSQTFIIGVIMMSMGMSMTTNDFKILAGFFAWLDKKAEEPHNEKAAVKVSVVSKNSASAD